MELSLINQVFHLYMIIVAKSHTQLLKRLPCCEDDSSFKIFTLHYYIRFISSPLCIKSFAYMLLRSPMPSLEQKKVFIDKLIDLLGAYVQIFFLFGLPIVGENTSQENYLNGYLGSKT